MSGFRSGRTRWLRLCRTLTLAAVAALAGALPSVALATPGGGVSATEPAQGTATPGGGVLATELAQGTSAHGLRLRTGGPTRVVVRTVTIEPGGSTGWHYHLGQLIVVVKSGTLTRTLSDCSVETSTAGQSFVEPAGADHVHVGRNLGTEPVVLYLTYLLPEGSPLSVDAPAPGCDGP